MEVRATATVEWQRLWLRRRRRCGRWRRSRRRTSPAHSEHKHTSAKLASRRSGRRDVAHVDGRGGRTFASAVALAVEEGPPSPAARLGPIHWMGRAVRSKAHALSGHTKQTLCPLMGGWRAVGRRLGGGGRAARVRRDAAVRTSSDGASGNSPGTSMSAAPQRRRSLHRRRRKVSWCGYQAVGGRWQVALGWQVGGARLSRAGWRTWDWVSTGSAS